MSTLVDERVVEMKFDNRDFERNTRQSMSTIQNLKAALNFSGTAKSLNDSFNSVDTNPLIASLEKAEKTFSAWEVMAISAISNITNRLVDLGINLAKSLSVDQIMAGWEQFGELTRNTGTMIAQLTGKGYDEASAINMTNEAMDKFMWYADATSFSIEQMTSAASKFINNGKSLDEAFTIVAGIGNLGASAGKSAQDLIPIFESVSKVGDRIMTQQYNSFQLAGIMTEEFRKKLLDAAAAEGTLTKFTDTFDGSIEYYLDDMAITVENFRDSISKGWLSSDIFFKTLDQYGSSVQKIYDLNKTLQEQEDELGSNKEVSAYEAIDTFNDNATKAVESAKELLAAAKELGDETAIANAELELSAALANQFSGKWTKAATEARTFKEAVDAVKDAVKTEWARIFTLIIGDYKKATEVWSNFSDKLYDMFAAPLASIRKLIESDNFAAIQENLFGNVDEEADKPIGAIWNVMNAIQKFIETVKEAWKEVFKTNTSLSQITEKFQKFSEKLILSGDTAENVKSIFKGIFSIFKLGIKILQGVKVALTPIFNAISGDAGNFIKFLANMGESFASWVDETQIFITIGGKISEVLTTIIDKLKELKLIEKLRDSFTKFFEKLKASEELKKFMTSFKETCKKVFTFLIDSIKKIIEFSAKYLIPALANIGKYLLIIISVVGAGVGKAVRFLIESIGKLVDFLKGNETIQNGWMKFISFLRSIPDRLKNLQPFFIKVGTAIGDFFKAVWGAIKKLGEGIANVFKLQTIGELFKKIGNSIAYGFRRIVEGIQSLSSSDTSGAVDGIKKKLGPLEPLFKGLIDLFKGLWTVFKALIPLIGNILSAVGNLLTQVGNSITKTFNQKIDENGGINLWYLINGGIGLLIAKGLYDFVYLFNGVASSIANTIDSLGGVMRAKAVMMWATAIKTVAMAILMLVGSIILITLIDESKLNSAINTLAKVMGLLGAAIIIIASFLKTTYKMETTTPMLIKGKGLSGGSNTSSGTGFKGVAGMIIGFGIAILALVAALKIIDGINPDKIDKDLMILAALMGMLAISIGLMNFIANLGNRSKKGIKGIKGVLSFAIAMWVLLIPIQKLGDMPIEKLRQSLVAIGLLLLAYAGAVRIANGLKAKSMSKIVAFAAGMTALVGPVQMLGNMDIWTLIRGVAGITILIGSFTKMARLSSEFKVSSAVALIATIATFGFVMNAIVSLINGPISQITNDAIIKYAVIATSILLFVGSLALLISQMNKKTIKIEKEKSSLLKNLSSIAVILAALSATIVLLMIMAKMMNTVDWGAFGATLGLFAIVIGATIGALMYAKKIKADKNMLTNVGIMSMVLGALTTTLLTLAILMKVLSTISTDPRQVLGLVIAALATVILGMITLTALSSRLNGNAYKGILAISSIFAALAGLMLGFAALIKVMDSANGDTIINVVKLLGVALLGAIGVILIASKFNSKLSAVANNLIKLGSAFALFGLGAAAFAVAIAVIKNNLAGMLMFTVSILALSVAMKTLSSQTATMYSMAAIFAAIGVAILAVGASMYLISMALEKMIPQLDELASKSDSLRIVLSNAIQGVLEGVANALPLIAEKVMVALDILLEWIIDKIKSLAQWFLDLDLKDLFKITEKINILLIGMLMQALAYLASQAGVITGHLLDIIISAIYALIERLPVIAQAIIDFVIGLLDSFGEALKNNAERLRESMINFAKNMWQAFLSFFGIHSPSKESENAAGNIVAGLVQGLSKGLNSVVNTLLKMGQKMLRAVLQLPKAFIKAGAEIFRAFLNGIKSVVFGIIDFCKSIWEKIKSIFTGGSQKEEFKDAGKTAMASYKDGMETVDDDVNQTAKQIIQQTVEELSKTDYFKAIGEEIVKNIAYGIELNAYMISDAMDGAISEALDSTSDAYDALASDLEFEESYDNVIGTLTDPLVNMFSNVMSRIENFIRGGMKEAVDLIKSSTPEIQEAINNLYTIVTNELLDEDVLTIRPVMDISDIEEKTATIAGMLYSVSGINVATVTAEKASAEINSAKRASEESISSSTTQLETTGSQGEVYNVTFNITGNDPKAIADEVSKRFEQYTSRRNTAYGRGNI